MNKISSGSTEHFKKRENFDPIFLPYLAPSITTGYGKVNLVLNNKTGLLLRDIACTQTLFYFSFRSLRKDRRARDRSKRARTRASAEREKEKFLLPVALEVSKSAPDLFFIMTAQRTLKRK